MNLDVQVLYFYVLLIVVNMHVDQLLWMKCIRFNFLPRIIMIRTGEFFCSLFSPFYTIHETSLNCAFQKQINSKVQKPTSLPSNHLSGPLRKQKFTLTGSKGHGSVGTFRSVLCVSWFDVYNRNYNWRLRKRQLWR